MSSINIKGSGFSLAKGKELVGDDFYDFKIIGNVSIAVVCDGVGSAAEGAEAAKRVTNYLINNFKIRPKSWSIEKSISTFIKSINAILYQESQTNYERSELVTTLTLVVIEGNRLYGANVGDSRIYLFRDKTLTQLSFDHSMDEAGYENVLTQAIGIEKDVEPYYFENIIQKGDKILLCSDGLYNIMSDNRLERGISSGASSLVKKASRLMEDMLPDDTTAVVLDILKADEIEGLKQQKLFISQKLNRGENIDGYVLEKSLINNNRTWLCSKKTKQYVIKFAPLEVIDDTKKHDLFIKEAWNAKRLKYEIFPKAVIPKNRTQCYYIMQYFKGENLNDYLSTNCLSIDDTVQLAATLLKMAQYLLKYDLVHGDIKPHNIIILKDKQQNSSFKIIDFGNMTEIFSTDTKAGTPSFLSPDRFQNEAISESSEMFSIGVTLYLCLSGKYPYGEIEPFQNPVFKNAKKPSTYNKNIPDWLDSVILRSISTDKNARYNNYSEMDFEINNPHKVKPFFFKESTIIERSPALFYRWAFTIMFVINLFLVLYCCK
ncbi:protein phosphatase 2C domain-containing protein [bacterium]|nr:protein phosphatase 2C domain-containing protein [bacterium]MBU1990623.1 protein phosphatase 2C domain-containing protein [bacterium]